MSPVGWLFLFLGVAAAIVIPASLWADHTARNASRAYEDDGK